MKKKVMALLALSISFAVASAWAHTYDETNDVVYAALSRASSYYDDLRDTYMRKRDYFCRKLDEAGLKHNVPQGSYFVLVDISEFLALPKFAGWTDMQFCEWMIREVGVAAVPGSSFFREPVNHLIRLHFAREEATLDEAGRRLMRMHALANE